MSMSAVNRPRAENLRQLPTLAVQTPDSPTVSENARALAKRYGISYVLELKLETPQARYWFCTKGLPAPGTASAEQQIRADMHFPESWIEGYVTMDLKEPNEDGDY